MVKENVPLEARLARLAGRPVDMAALDNDRDRAWLDLVAIRILIGVPPITELVL